MSEPFLGEIKMFAGSFNPRGFAFCDGQLLAVSQNDALFSLFGTIYGGDGRTTFGLPDLRGRLPIHQGQGPGLSNRRLGSKSGSENVGLSVNQLPSHSHTIRASGEAADSKNPAGRTIAASTELAYASSGDGDPVSMALESVTNAQGGNVAHSNVQPFLCINFIVALVGIYPSRS